MLRISRLDLFFLVCASSNLVSEDPLCPSKRYFLSVDGDQNGFLSAQELLSFFHTHQGNHNGETPSVNEEGRVQALFPEGHLPTWTTFQQTYSTLAHRGAGAVEQVHLVLKNEAGAVDLLFVTLGNNDPSKFSSSVTVLMPGITAALIKHSSLN